jgi:exopolyphosphatase/guanosine-5'-triphosphate,3'-diphosphate pyrophosphatase
MIAPGPGALDRPVVRAAIDAGSNSVHVLVALVDGHRVRPIADESTFLGLGVAAAAGAFGGQLIDHLSATVTRYVRLAHGLGAASSAIAIVGTEPFRRAADAALAMSSVRRATGLRPVRLSHVEEALLTLIGVTNGRRISADLLVSDVGGGSIEMAMAGLNHRPQAFGIRGGSASLTDSHVRHDPPTDDEIHALHVAARALLRRAPRIPPRRLVAVGGSATNLIRVLPIATLDRVLTRERLAEISATLATEPALVAAERHGLNLVRARLLPAGAAILDAVLERYETSEADVMDAGIREGIVLAMSRAGAAWRDDLRRVAAGWGSATDA